MFVFDSFVAAVGVLRAGCWGYGIDTALRCGELLELLSDILRPEQLAKCCWYVSP